MIRKSISELTSFEDHQRFIALPDKSILSKLINENSATLSNEINLEYVKQHRLLTNGPDVGKFGSQAAYKRSIQSVDRERVSSSAAAAASFPEIYGAEEFCGRRDGGRSSDLDGGWNGGWRWERHAGSFKLIIDLQDVRPRANKSMSDQTATAACVLLILVY